MNKRSLTLLCGAGAGVLLLTALLLALTTGAATGTTAKPTAKPKPHGVPAPFGSVEFFISETELEATNTIGPKEVPTPPKTDPAKLSDAYEYEYTKGKSTFVVKQDVFTTAAITVHQGDVVALRIFDVEGHHDLTLLDPTGASVFKKNKTYAGREYLKVFTANQLGIYRLLCENHEPTMKVVITVLRKGA